MLVNVNFNIKMLKLMLTNMEFCHGFWLAESEAVSQSDAMTQIYVNLENFLVSRETLIMPKWEVRGFNRHQCICF